MNKIIFSLFALLAFSAGSVHADSAHFALEPTASGQVWQGVNAAGDGAGDHYSRNMFFDFSNVLTIGNGTAGQGLGVSQAIRDVAYYGVKDTSTLWNSDSVVLGGATNPSISSGKFGLGGNNAQTGSATFNIANFSPSATIPMYFWLETDVILGTNGGASSASAKFSLAGVSQSAFWLDGVSVSGVSNTYTLNGTALKDGVTQRVNAWFKFDSFPSSEALVVDFAKGAGTGSNAASAFIDNLHIATTPEPISTALFLAGGAVMAFRRRLIPGLA